MTGAGPHITRMSIAESFNPTGINLTARAVEKVRELVSEEENQDLKLRVFITGGGCSGFQLKKCSHASRNTFEAVFCLNLHCFHARTSFLQPSSEVPSYRPYFRFV